MANKNEDLNHQRSLNVLKNVDSNRRFWRIFSYSEFAPFVEPGIETRGGKSLEMLRRSNDSRRELLQNAMAKKQEAKGYVTHFNSSKIFPEIYLALIDQFVLRSENSQYS